MNSTVLLAVVFGYFAILLAIAWYTSRGAGEHAFYGSERKSLWWVLAFGMVGTSLSGVTFVSVPGMVRGSHWNYMQMVLGFVLGYWIVAGVLVAGLLQASRRGFPLTLPDFRDRLPPQGNRAR